MVPGGGQAGAEPVGEAREVAQPEQEKSLQPRSPHPGKSRRQAPEVTHEWPTARPTPRPPTLPWPLVLMAGLLTLVVLGLVPGLTTPAGLAASLTALSALALRMCLKMKDPADQALQRAQRAIWLDEDPRVVIMRLRGVGLRVRPRLRRDIAVRCLEQARRSEHLDRSMRREAARWVRATRDELHKETGR